MNRLLLVCFAAAVAGGAAAASAAQPPAAETRRAAMVLPPGDHDLFDVIERAGEVLGKRYRIDARTREAVRAALRLQNPLALPPDGCEGIVSRLARARGLVLVPGDAGGRWVWTQGPDRASIRRDPVECEPDDVFDPQAPIVAVRTRLPVGSESARPLVYRLRPFFAFGDGGLRLADADGAIELTGLRDEVAAALRLIRGAFGVEVPGGGGASAMVRDLIAMRAAAGEGSFRLAAGEHPFREVLDRVALLTGTNHLVDAAEADVSGVLDAATTVTRGNALEVLSALGAAAQLTLLPLAPKIGLYEWVSARGPRRGQLQSLAEIVDADTAAKLDGLRVAITTPIKLEHANARVASMRLRPAFAAAGGLVIGSLGDDNVLLSGVSDVVADAVRMVRELDESEKKDGRQKR